MPWLAATRAVHLSWSAPFSPYSTDGSFPREPRIYADQLNLDDKLLTDLMQVTDAKTKTDTIQEAMGRPPSFLFSNPGWSIQRRERYGRVVFVYRI